MRSAPTECRTKPVPRRALYEWTVPRIKGEYRMLVGVRTYEWNRQRILGHLQSVRKVCEGFAKALQTPRTVDYPSVLPILREDVAPTGD